MQGIECRIPETVAEHKAFRLWVNAIGNDPDWYKPNRWLAYVSEAERQVENEQAQVH